MKPEAQRIAIAEACGWKDEHKKWEGFDVWTTPQGITNYGRKGDKFACLPDYLSDLNAMHEAEKVLKFSGRNQYCKELQNLCSKGIEPYRVTEAACIFTTAEQRAEAFLQTLGKWDNDK